VTYTFDANGNLLSDGVNEYIYDAANRLIEASTSSGGAEYLYNGLGDRIAQVVQSAPGSPFWETTNYTLDLNTGLTQVLSDGTTDYLYGNGRIAQVNTSAEYFLADALGSVRQMSNPAGEITFAQTYDPYGVVTYTTGVSQTEVGFTGEQYGDSTQLLYLRARHYSPADGRFTSRDTWSGDVNRPLSLNRWNYVEGNPVNYVDPTGYIKEGSEAWEAYEIVKWLRMFNIGIGVDWGYLDTDLGILDWWKYSECDWVEGAWKIEELRAIEEGVAITRGGIHRIGGNFFSLIGPVRILREISEAPSTTHGNVITFRNTRTHKHRLYVTIHELGHVVAHNNPGVRDYFGKELGATCRDGDGQIIDYCHEGLGIGVYNPGPYAHSDDDLFSYMLSVYSRTGIGEDFAETFTVIVAEEYIAWGGVYSEGARLVYNDFNNDIRRRRTVMKAIIDGSWRR
jgi:RHS repeat-associated protein